MTPELRQWVPIAISCLSLLLSGIALGWNVYRDVILKARVVVSVSVVNLVESGQRVRDGQEFVRISAANHGPGQVRIDMIHGQRTSAWRRLIRRPRHFVILNDHMNPLNPKLPYKIDVGDTVTLLLPYNSACFLGESVSHIGLSDSFGRLHYAPHRQLRVAQRQYQKDFVLRSSV